MAFEQFKTQVLLLHSEQKKLDSLSTGFGDRYELHCATSGTEALNTLGVTPVDVIVSAQKLPGMSGLDALREAKKRSPKTITILLAGPDINDGLEALVSDKEVFQVVRGEMTPERLLEVVENATRTARLMSLSKSANDQSADVDKKPNADDSGEHIVMETDQTGSFVVSDGTGQFPSVKPGKVSARPSAPGRQVDLLVLTQDEDFLETISNSTGRNHRIHRATKPSQAEDFVRNFPVGVIVTDAALAGASVEALIQRMRTHNGRLVAVVAGRRDDGEMLMDLINRGQVYRFLLKPVSPGRARLAIEASVRHHLDAPDQAFVGRPAVKAPPARPAPPVGQKPAARTAAQVQPGKPAAVARSATNVTPSAAAGGLDDAFDEGRSLTETVTDLAATISKSLKREKRAKIEPKLDAPKPAASKAGRGTERPAPAVATPAPASGNSILTPKVIGIAAAFLIAVAAGGYLLFSGGDDSNVGNVVADAPADTGSAEPEASVPAPAPTPRPAADNAVAADTPETLLARARAARDTGDVYSPAGRNAVEFYLAAREAAPADPRIAAELQTVVNDVFGQAEAALLESRTIEASRALRVLGLVDGDNPRLNFLKAQLAQQQLRSTLDDARVAIREARFEDAGRLLSGAEAFAAGNTAELEALSQELSQARSAQQLDDVLELAGQRLTDNRLVEPSNDNARYYFELARTIDPDSSAAAQGLLAVASKLVLRARAAIDEGDLDAADALLSDARILDPNSAELMTVAAALNAARNPPPDSAPARAPSPAPVRTAPAAAAPAASTAPPDTTSPEPALAAGTEPGGDAIAERPEAPAGNPAGGGESESATANAAGTQGGAETDAPEEIVAIGALKRTKYVPPNYPRSAQRRNLSGYVDVAFTVTTSGSVTNVEVREADPAGVFDDAATDAIEQWEFEPATENGEPVSKRVAVRMSFNLQ